MHQNLIKILQGLQDKTHAEDADIGRLIVCSAGLDKRTVEKYHNYLTEQKIIWHTGQRKYRVDRKKVRKILDDITAF